MPNRYSDEVRALVIDAIKSGMDHRQITASFGPSKGTQRAWYNQYLIDTGQKSPDHAAGELSTRERELHAENVKLKQQVAILERATSYFAARCDLSPK